MPHLLLVIGFDAHHPAELAHFWAGVLGREVVADPRGPLLPGSDTQLGLRIASRGTEAADPARRYMHLHVTSERLPGWLWPPDGNEFWLTSA